MVAKSVYDALVTFSRGVGLVAVSRVDGSTGKLGTTRAEVVSFTANLLDLEDAGNKVVRERDIHLLKIQTESKMSEGYNINERNCALSCHYSVLQFVQGTVKAADEHGVSHNVMFTQMWCVFEEQRKV